MQTLKFDANKLAMLIKYSGKVSGIALKCIIVGSSNLSYFSLKGR